MTPEEFRAIRKQLGMTQAALAERLGYARAGRIAKLEGGQQPVPPLLERLMQAYADGYVPRRKSA